MEALQDDKKKVAEQVRQARKDLEQYVVALRDDSSDDGDVDDMSTDDQAVGRLPQQGVQQGGGPPVEVSAAGAPTPGRLEAMRANWRQRREGRSRPAPTESEEEDADGRGSRRAERRFDRHDRGGRGTERTVPVGLRGRRPEPRPQEEEGEPQPTPPIDASHFSLG